MYIFFNKSNNIVSKAGARGRGINSWDNQILEVENVIYINRSLYWGYFGSYMILGGKTGKTKDKKCVSLGLGRLSFANKTIMIIAPT